MYILQDFINHTQTSQLTNALEEKSKAVCIEHRNGLWMIAIVLIRDYSDLQFFGEPLETAPYYTVYLRDVFLKFLH